MTRNLWQRLGTGLLGAALLIGGVAAAQGQEYWRSYRTPYYGTYRSYYTSPSAYSSYYGPRAYRTYSVQPYYYNYGAYNYGAYNAGPVYRSYYAPTYYGTPYAGYYESPYVGRGVQVGRLRIGW